MVDARHPFLHRYHNERVVAIASMRLLAMIVSFSINKLSLIQEQVQCRVHMSKRVNLEERAREKVASLIPNLLYERLLAMAHNNMVIVKVFNRRV